MITRINALRTYAEGAGRLKQPGCSHAYPMHSMHQFKVVATCIVQRTYYISNGFGLTPASSASHYASSALAVVIIPLYQLIPPPKADRKQPEWTSAFQYPGLAQNGSP